MEKLENLRRIRDTLKDAVERETLLQDERWEETSRNRQDFKAASAFQKQRETALLAMAAFQKANEAYQQALRLSKQNREP
ncbi:MAG: hypothetical protein M3Z09_08270 [Acidobacteriota bacterium]|nr:hypothetical protein [Acidobacteriota bacterium]